MKLLFCLLGILAFLAGGRSVDLEQPVSTPCPLYCDCFFSNSSVVCSMHDGHFPTDLPGDTQSLTLRPLSNKIRFLFLHNFFASSSPTYPYLRSFELRLEASSTSGTNKTSDRTKVRIHQGAFSRSRFPMLETFSLNGGAVLSLSATFLQDAPSLVSLDLHDLLINELQPETFAPVGSSLENLNLSMNSIRKIDNDTFKGLTNLLRLDLSHNQITLIHPEAFSDMTRLAELYLQGNNLLPIKEPQIFPQTLAVLDLSQNSKMTSFSSFLFSQTNRMNTLRLNRVPLNAMSQQQLSNALAPLAKSLKILELDGSVSQKSMGPKSFRGFHLERLSLIGNQLVSLDFLTANDVVVETLLVDKNNLTCLCLSNRTTINRSIKYLSATFNKITSLDDSQMRAFPALRFLNLSVNTLRLINDSAFSSLSLLNVLDLSNNSLQELPRTAFLASSFPQINNAAKQSQLVTISAPLLVVPRLSQVKLRVHNNPFHCNADLLWLKELYDRSSERHQSGTDEFPVNEPSCATPYPPAPFSRLSPQNFRSFHPTARILNGAKNFTASEGEPLNLTCEVFGDPSPRVIWRISPDRETIFNPTNISERRRVVQILLTNVQKGNEGLVTCLAVNRIGSHAATSHVFVSAPRLSWESVVDITLTAFVSCFVAVVIIALVVWACVTRRRHHTRLGRAFAKSIDDNGSGRSAVSSNASSRQPSKSPSTSTGAESLLAFDEKSSQKHLHRAISSNGVPEEEPAVHAMLLEATDNVSGAPTPASAQRNGINSLRVTNNGSIRTPTAVPLLVLDECDANESLAIRQQSHVNGLNNTSSLLMKTSCHDDVEIIKRPIAPIVNGVNPNHISHNRSGSIKTASVQQQTMPEQDRSIMGAKRVKLVSSSLTPRVYNCQK